ncbi:MAG: Response regulator receiver protein [uncultured bacterium]|nr:MAG: Response regulator receiver protein [uncultured bacterium]
MAKILLIDDSNMARRLLRKILEAKGHQILEAVDGLSGMETFALEKPDMVFLDLSMAGMSGLDVLAQLRQFDAKTPVFIASADVQSMTREIAMADGATGYLVKPLEAEQVLTVVNRALGRENTP